MSKPLTAKQQLWSEHLQQAEQFEGSLAEYARSHNLLAQNLYQWRNVLRKKEMASPATKTVFAEVSPPTFSRPSLTLQMGAAQLVFSTLPDSQWLAQLIAAHD